MRLARGIVYCSHNYLMEIKSKMMKRIITAIALIAGIFSGWVDARADKTYKVFLSQVVEHPALLSTRMGIVDAMRKHSIAQGQNLDFRYESAQGSSVVAKQIAAKFVNDKPDIVVGLGTISAQSFIKLAGEQKVKLIFSSITDPLSAGLMKDQTHLKDNITGVSNFIELEPQLELFKKILPSMKKIGVLYNPGEPNSVTIVKKLEQICPTLGLTLVTQTINKTSDVSENAADLIKQTDALFISNDNTALSALSNIIYQANKAKKPVFISDTDEVEHGALAALGPDQYELGLQTGEMIVRILQGQKIESQELEFPNTTKLYVNISTAKKLGLEIPHGVLKHAVQVTSVN